MFVNNETGVVQPIKEIGIIAKQKKITFFCDATQAVGKIKVDVLENNIDLLCFSGHKLKAPKGVGVLYGKYAGTELKLEGKDYLIMREDDILAII